MNEEKFSKQEIIDSDMYKCFKYILLAILEDDVYYTKNQITTLLSKTLKKKIERKAEK